MSNRSKKLLIILVGILVASNIYSYCSSSIVIGKYYYFASKSENFKYDVIPSKGRDINTMERNYSSFLEKQKLEREELYQLVPVKVLKFWNWHELIWPRRSYDNYKKKYKIRI